MLSQKEKKRPGLIFCIFGLYTIRQVIAGERGIELARARSVFWFFFYQELKHFGNQLEITGFKPIATQKREKLRVQVFG
jgi:hypothetical protein